MLKHSFMIVILYTALHNKLEELTLSKLHNPPCSFYTVVYLRSEYELYICCPVDTAGRGRSPGVLPERRPSRPSAHLGVSADGEAERV